MPISQIFLSKDKINVNRKHEQHYVHELYKMNMNYNNIMNMERDTDTEINMKTDTSL
jgi:hypothetical protein